jgi:hypothetical protein
VTIDDPKILMMFYLQTALEFLILVCPFWFFLYHFVGELKFYRRQHWDFEKKDPSWRPTFRYGDAPGGSKNIVSNREKMFVAYPLFVLGCGICQIIYFLFYDF